MECGLDGMDRLSVTHLEFSADFHQALFVELSGSHIFSRNELDGIMRPKHPRQTDCHSLKLCVKHDDVCLGVNGGGSVHGQEKIHQPAMIGGME